MLEPKRVEMNVQPNSIEKLGNGTYYYNYDITSKEVDVTDPETEEVTQETRWTYIQFIYMVNQTTKNALKLLLDSM